MFQGLAQGGIPELLAHLEQHALMLSSKDQEFVQGCQMALQTGGVLTHANQQELRRIAGTLVQTEHHVVDEPISVTKMLQDLGSAIHMLTPEEKAFLGPLALKAQKKQQITAEEMQRLLKIHTDKGF
jgi:hypothetical protein